MCIYGLVIALAILFAKAVQAIHASAIHWRLTGHVFNPYWQACAGPRPVLCACCHELGSYTSVCTSITVVNLGGRVSPMLGRYRSHVGVDVSRGRYLGRCQVDLCLRVSGLIAGSYWSCIQSCCCHLHMGCFHYCRLDMLRGLAVHQGLCTRWDIHLRASDESTTLYLVGLIAFVGMA